MYLVREKKLWIPTSKIIIHSTPFRLIFLKHICCMVLRYYGCCDLAARLSMFVYWRRTFRSLKALVLVALWPSDSLNVTSVFGSLEVLALGAWLILNMAMVTIFRPQRCQNWLYSIIHFWGHSFWVIPTSSAVVRVYEARYVCHGSSGWCEWFARSAKTMSGAACHEDTTRDGM